MSHTHYKYKDHIESPCDPSFGPRKKELEAQKQTDHIAKRINDESKELDAKELIVIEDSDSRKQKQIPGRNYWVY